MTRMTMAVPVIPARDTVTSAEWWGAREFAVVDGDGNLLTFFQR